VFPARRSVSELSVQDVDLSVCIEQAEIAGIIRDEDEVVLYRIVDNHPVLPPCPSQMCDMMGLKALRFSRARNFYSKTFVYQEFHDAARSLSRTRTSAL